MLFTGSSQRYFIEEERRTGRILPAWRRAILKLVFRRYGLSAKKTYRDGIDLFLRRPFEAMLRSAAKNEKRAFPDRYNRVRQAALS